MLLLTVRVALVPTALLSTVPVAPTRLVTSTLLPLRRKVPPARVRVLEGLRALTLSTRTTPLLTTRPPLQVLAAPEMTSVLAPTLTRRKVPPLLVITPFKASSPVPPTVVSAVMRKTPDQPAGCALLLTMAPTPPTPAPEMPPPVTLKSSPPAMGWPLRARAAPLRTTLPPAVVPRAVGLPRMTVPAALVKALVKPLAPPRKREPAPSLVTLTALLIAPSQVLFTALLMISGELVVPALPTAPKPLRPLMRRTLLDNCSVPPLIWTVLRMLELSAPLLTMRVPALMVTPPVNLLLLVSTRVPAPDLTSATTFAALLLTTDWMERVRPVSTWTSSSPPTGPPAVRKPLVMVWLAPLARRPPVERLRMAPSRLERLMPAAAWRLSELMVVVPARPVLVPVPRLTLSVATQVPGALLL